MSGHALLGPSSSKMWLNCSGSARLNEALSESTSEYAEEGKLAHAIGEEMLLKGKSCSLREFSKSKFYNQEMVDHCKAYYDYVAAQPGDELLVEQRLDYSDWVPDGFGTGDAIKVDDNTLRVIDLKYGKGVPVVAEGNTQLKFYALGAINALGCLFEFEKVEVHIFQPRLGAPTAAEYDVEEILKWADSIKEQAQKAWDGVEEYHAGDWCTFCRAKGQCKARCEQEAMKAFSELETTPDEYMANTISPNLMMDQEVVYWLSHADAIIKFLKDLQDHAADKAINHGKQWTGFKLVEGKSVRKYSDPEALMKELELLGVEGYAKTELVGVTEMEKILGKKDFKAIVEPNLVKAPGNPTLVPESDKRPAIDSNRAATEAFQNE